MTPLTKAQQRVVDYWNQYRISHGQPPTVRQACKALGIASTNAIAEHIKAIERRGIVLVRRRSRTVISSEETVQADRPALVSQEPAPPTHEQLDTLATFLEHAGYSADAHACRKGASALRILERLAPAVPEPTG